MNTTPTTRIEASNTEFEPTSFLDSSATIEKRSNTAKVVTFLRGAGIALILLSALGYMLHGYADVGPQLRYWIGLILTLGLTSGGAICAYAFRDNTGVRIFLGLALLFVVVQSTQVAAMLFGFLHPDMGTGISISWLKFAGVSQSLIILDVTATSLIMLALAYLGFKTLARANFMMLTSAYIVGNILVWLPVRLGPAAILLILCLFAYLYKIELVLRKDYTMRTWEGHAARLLIFTPLIFMLGRSQLYTMDINMLAAQLGLLSFILIWELKFYTKSQLLLTAGQAKGMFLAGVTWLLIYSEHFESYVTYQSCGLILPLGIIWLALSFKTKHGSTYRILASIITLAALTFDGAPAIIQIINGMFWTAIALQLRERQVLFTGMFGMAFGLLLYANRLFTYYAEAPWISSIILGISVILLAAWIEKNNSTPMHKLKKYYLAVREW